MNTPDAPAPRLLAAFPSNWRDSFVDNRTVTRLWTRHGSARAVVAIAAACLVLLQVLSLALLPTGQVGRVWGTSAEASTIVAKCNNTDVDGGGKFPKSPRHHHESCVFCVARGHLSSFDPAILQMGTARLVPLSLISTLASSAIATLGAPPKGWINSYSSRGPPIFS